MMVDEAEFDSMDYEEPDDFDSEDEMWCFDDDDEHLDTHKFAELIDRIESEGKQDA